MVTLWKNHIVTLQAVDKSKFSNCHQQSDVTWIFPSHQQILYYLFWCLSFMQGNSLFLNLYTCYVLLIVL